MLTIVQLARAGDVLSIIPAVDAMRNGERVNWLVHEHYATILDNLSWIDKHVWKGGDSQVREATRHAEKHIGGTVIATQVHGNPAPRTQTNFILDQWARAGMLDRFHDCPLKFDRLQKQLALPREYDGPVCGYTLSGHSSPFRHAHAFKAWLDGLQTQFRCVDLSDIRGGSVVDVLGVLRQCDLLITIDSALLHLAYAAGVPTIALSRPLEWYMSEPRWHWIARLTYDEAIQADGKGNIEFLMRRPLAELNAMRGRVCRRYAPLDETRQIVHVVDWFEATGETKRRHEFARYVWRGLELADKHWSTIEVTAYPRSSKSIGDTRDLPFLKDTIDRGVANAGDDEIVCLTNADTCMFAESPAAIRREMHNKPCVCSGRIDVARADRPLNIGDSSGARIYVGTDLFAFTPAWWRSVRDKIPDMLIACEGWDFVLYKMMERDNAAARLKYALCYHESHTPFWTQNLVNNPGQQYNRKLGRQWAIDFGFTEFLDDGRYLFRSTPKKNAPKGVELPAPDPQPEILTGDVTGMPADGELARMLETIIMRIKPARILETGTYLGTGSTRIVLDALKKHGLSAEFVSIECNPDHHAKAAANLAGASVRLMHALSMPRAKLPSQAAIEVATVTTKPTVKYIDHMPDERAEKYFAETNFPDIEDDAIGKTLERWRGNADLIILDSAGHIGKLEFDYVVQQLREPCIIVLDDSEHAKHAKSLALARRDRRFQIVVEGAERCGFAILDYTPKPSGRLMPRLRQLEKA